MPVKQTLEGGRVPVKVWTDDLDAATQQQLRNVASLPIVHGHVAAMPDVHLGKGATVGSVIATKKAIVPAAVGVDIGCFRGDTKIPLLDGRQASLRELAQRTEPFWVYSIDRSGHVVPGKARCKRTRRNAALMRVVVSGGEEIVCTPDHEFLLTNGTYRPAKDLRFNDSLMPLYRKWQARDGYESVSAGKGQSVLTHVMVWESLHGPAPPGHVVHHINHVHFDNRPENLTLMTNRDHSAHHRASGRTFANADPRFQALRHAGIQRRLADPVKLAQMKQVGLENITAYMRQRPEHFAAAVVGNGKRGAPYLAKFNASPRICGDCGAEEKNPAALRWHKRRTHGYNHKVISTRPLEERADVYCLQVEEHHNFALAAGVFVHNCGMMAACTTLTAEDLDEKTLKKVFDQISRDVPLGFEQHADNRRHTDAARPLEPGLTRITQKHPDVMKKAGRHSHWVNQLGTLGGGNHFIEVCLDEAGRVWVMLHSGSRGIGNAIGTYFIELARKDMERQDAQLPDRDLAYLTEGTEHFDDYVEAVGWAQDYARQNREVMMGLVLAALRRHTQPFEVVTQAIQCHHNYVERERHFGEDLWVTRKGAIRAGKGELGILPGSMGTRSYIVRGKGNPESFQSCSHGAGRVMSRGEAKKRFTVEDHVKATEGIECRKDASVIDETPMAYKDIDKVMAAQSDLVDVVHELRQVVCVKG